MALSKQPIAIPLSGGLDRKTDPKQAPIARLLVCQNARFDVGSTLVKRNGYEAFSKSVTSTGTDYSDVRTIATRGDELVLLTDGAAYSHQASTGTWNSIGEMASVSASDQAIAATGTNQTTPDAATNGGVTLVGWEDSRGGVWWTLIEADGGRILRAPAQMDANGQRPRCVACGTVLHLLYATATGELRIAVVNPAAPLATVTPVALTTDLSTTNPSFDAVPTTLNADNPALLVWATTGGFRLGYVHPSGVLGSPLTGLPDIWNDSATFDVGPVVSTDNSEIAVGYHRTSTTTSTLAWFSPDDLQPDTSATEVEPAAAVRLALSLIDGNAAYWRELTAGTNRDHRVRVWVGGQGQQNHLTDLRGCGIASGGFGDDGISYVWLVHDVSFFSVYLCMRATTAGTTCVARSLPGVAYGLPPRAHLPSVETDASDSRVHRWCGSWQQQLATDDSSVFAEVGIRRIELDFDADDAWQTAQLGQSLYIGGACPLRYDGDTIAEAGWHYAADDVAAPTQGTGGGLELLGTYVYRFVYEEIDAQGEIHRGPTSIGTEVTLTGSNNRLTFAIPTYRITGRRRVRIGVFRTEANDASGGLYRVSSLDPSAAGSNGYAANDTTVDTVTFVDDMSDATLLTKEPLYTNGDIPSNDPTGSGSVIVAGKNRLFYTDSSDPLVVRYTQEIADGYAAEWNLELSLKVDPYGGPVTALAVMDDRLIVFKRSAIFVVTGAGPLRNPIADPSQGFSQAQLVTTDAGCTSPASIAVTPVGLVFQSAKGIYMLGRDMSVAYVGAPVEAFNSQTVTRATLIEDRRQIVFLCSTGETLMFDYGAGQWSTYTNHTGLGAVMLGGRYHYLRTDGRVFRETPGEYRDDNSQIRMVLETAWIKMVPFLQGFSRFYHVCIIGERRSTHTIRFRYQTDYTASWSAPNNVDWTAESGGNYGDGNYGEGVYGGDSPEIWQWSVHLGEVGQAIRFRFEDVEPTGEFGASYEISELLIMGGIKQPAVRPLPAARTR